MFDVNKSTQKPAVIIRTASGYELSEYEKNKLAKLDSNAQENKIEIININGKRQQINPETKEVNIELGELAFRNVVTPDSLATNKLFFIRCELDESDMQEGDN